LITRGLTQSLIDDITQGITFSDVIRSTPLSDIISSNVFDVDVTLGASYDGSSQNWTSQGTPADGETASAYDFFLGSSSSPSTDDPTFVGTADDPAAHFLYDGLDRNRIQGGNTTFLNSLHKTDNSDNYTFAITIFWSASAASAQYYFGGTSNASADHGVRFVYEHGSDRFRFVQTDGTTSVTTFIDIGVTLIPDAWNFVVFTVNKTSGTDGTITATVNSVPPITTTLATFNADTTNASDDMQISGVSGSAQFPNLTRVAGCSMFNTALSASEIATLVAHYELRHERIYVNTGASIQSVIAEAVCDFDVNIAASNDGTDVDWKKPCACAI